MSKEDSIRQETCKKIGAWLVSIRDRWGTYAVLDLEVQELLAGHLPPQET